MSRQKKSENLALNAVKSIGAILWKFTKFIFSMFGRLLYIFLGFFKWLFSNIFHATKETIAQNALISKKPKITAAYSKFQLLEAKSGDLEKFEQLLLSPKSQVGIILGARGCGKSALGMRILENVHAKSGRKVCAMGFSSESIPSWIESIEAISEIKNGSLVLVDEGGIIFSARHSMADANSILSELLLISRHKDLSILFISQNSSNLDVNAIRQADYLLLRKSSLLQKDFERKKIQSVYEEAIPYFNSHPNEKQSSTYVYSDEFCGLMKNSLPSFWSDAASKSFKGFKHS
ncbi:MAG: zonular occludens toxin domain-containing protein [Candidatus Micrarchaeota archaeon]